MRFSRGKIFLSLCELHHNSFVMKFLCQIFNSLRVQFDLEQNYNCFFTHRETCDLLWSFEANKCEDLYVWSMVSGHCGWNFKLAVPLITYLVRVIVEALASERFLCLIVHQLEVIVAFVLIEDANATPVGVEVKAVRAHVHHDHYLARIPNPPGDCTINACKCGYSFDWNKTLDKFWW